MIAIPCDIIGNKLIYQEVILCLSGAAGMTKYEKNDQVTVVAEEADHSRIFRKWTHQVLKVISSSVPVRYNSIKRAIPGVTPFSLSDELKRLEAEGIIQRTVSPTKPPSVFYTLSAKGWELMSIITEIEDWQKRWN